MTKEETITITRDDDDWWIIRHEGLDVTTQGGTRLEALLMLADAIAAHQDSDEDLMEIAEDVFIPGEELEEFRNELEDDMIEMSEEPGEVDW